MEYCNQTEKDSCACVLEMNRMDGFGKIWLDDKRLTKWPHMTYYLLYDLNLCPNFSSVNFIKDFLSDVHGQISNMNIF